MSATRLQEEDLFSDAHVNIAVGNGIKQKSAMIVFFRDLH